MANSRRALGVLDRQQGRLVTSIAHLRAALSIDQTFGLRHEEAAELLGLANAAASLGHRSECRQFLVIRWLVLKDLDDLGTLVARQDAEKTYLPALNEPTLKIMFPHCWPSISGTADVGSLTGPFDAFLGLVPALLLPAASG